MLFHLAGAKRRLGELLGLDTQEGKALYQESQKYHYRSDIYFRFIEMELFTKINSFRVYC